MKLLKTENKQNMNNSNIRNVFLTVYGAISIATFYHTAWGFGTVMGFQPDNALDLAWWWLIGALSAFAVDVGMGGIVLALVAGYTTKWLKWSLFVLALFSAYAQLIYSAHHAANYLLGDVASWLQIPLQFVLDARVVLLPLVLPLFALIYAFAASAYQGQAQPVQLATQIELQEPEQLQLRPKTKMQPVQPEPVQAVQVATEAQPVQGSEVLQQLQGLDKAQAVPIIAKLEKQGLQFSDAELADAIGKVPSTIYRWRPAIDKAKLNGHAQAVQDEQ